MLNIIQFRESIVKSTLNDLLLYSPDLEELLVFTCATESNGGTYIRQMHGPALGIYQMEPETYSDIWFNYIRAHNSLGMKLCQNFNVSYIPNPDRLIYDLRYATAMAAILYKRLSAIYPKADDIEAIWEFYKQHWNTILGKAKKAESIEKYHDFIRG